MKKILALLALFLISFISLEEAKAQEFEGKITYKIDYIEVPAEVRGMESMMPQNLVMIVKGKKIAMQQDMMGGSQTVLFDGETDESAIVMDMMGQKLAIMVTAEEERQAREEMGEPELTYMDGTKEIAGFQCKKAEMKTGDQVIELWYTQEIKGAVHKDFTDLDGFPLEYLTFSQGMKLSITASQVDQTSQDDSVFEIPEGFQKITMDEFNSMMGGGY